MSVSVKFYISELQNSTPTYILYGIVIQPAQSVKGLGVVIDQDLKFHKHTSLVTNKANGVLGLIKRDFTHLFEP